MDIQEIKLTDLIIGKWQHRTESVGADIDELAESIKTRGLLQPISVAEAPSPNEDKYEIIMGQRRFLAFKKLGKESIPCIVKSKKDDELEYLIDSVTENISRRDTTSKENKEVCIKLWRRWGSIKSICEITGISEYFVRKHIKWATLPSELKNLVDEGTVSLDAATKAIEVQKYEEEPEIEETIEIAKSLHRIPQGARVKVKRLKASHQEIDTSKIISDIEKEDQIPSIGIRLSDTAYNNIKQQAKEEKRTEGEIASEIVEEAMSLENGE
jgi:ParB family transcriptional regulator, chromosome partitioning protein